MRKHINRIISATLAAAMSVSMISSVTASAEENIAFPYTLFAASEAEGAITTTAGNFCVNGNVCTNGTIVTGGNINVNGTKTENAGQDMIYIFDKIDTKYFSGNNVEEHTEDYVLDELNININTPIEVLGEAELTGNININTALKAFEDVSLNGEVKNTNDSVIYSKYGDIVIDSINVNLNGLVYAPFGDVVITAQNLNLNNVVIIADSITFDCPSVNANYSSSVADFVGTLSEPLNIPKDEWQYMKDKNGNGLPDFFEDFDNWSKLADTDGDGLPDSIEKYLGSDVNNTDTDGDGLGDFYEVFSTYTDPTKADTDENGVNDGDEDFDKDGLTNLDEFLNNTYPYIDDSDNDGLSDGDEVNEYGTDPLVADTDGDELCDGDELVLGTNPLVQDTDGNGIIDSKEKFNQTFTHKVKNEDCAVTEVSVSMECTGNINRTTSVESIMGKDYLCAEVVGLVGEPFEIETTSEFDTATLTFTIDKRKLGETEFDNLLFLWYNEEENDFVEIETTLDEENSTASITTTHFSKYMVVDKKAWFDAWAVQFNYNPSSDDSHCEQGGFYPTVRYNTALTIDCSGSMSWNDPELQRIDASNKFIDYMHSNDKISVVFFTNSAQLIASMTNDESTLRNCLKNVYSNGGTNFSVAINKAISSFVQDDINASYVNNRIILLSDGEDGSSSSSLNRALNICVDKNIKVYTVGFGSAQDYTMQRIANVTGGEYFKALSADDLVDIFAEIGYSSDFDKTDTDGDKLPDAVEAAGIRLQNGKILYDCDPTNPDSDDDGLLDGEEINPKPFYSDKEDNGWLGIKKALGVNTVQGYYFKMYSNPQKKDTDDDELDDCFDNKPLNSLIHAFVIYETETDEEYLHLVNTYDGNDPRRPEDFRYADLTEEDLRKMEHIYWGDFLNRNYFNNWKRLTTLLSMGEMQDVALEMMNHFVDGTGTDFHSNILNKNVDEHPHTKVYTDAVDSVFSSVISEVDGELYSLKYNKSTRNDSLIVKKMAEEINSGNTDLYMPFYNDKFSGLGITVDGLAGNRIEVSAFKLDGKHYSGTLHYVMYDIYGLDSTDITDEYAAFFDFGVLNGFRHWYILQHWDKYEGKNRPFITYMEFDRTFEGEIP